jgi:transcriptional regulator with XRE-family HTH domain
MKNVTLAHFVTIIRIFVKNSERQFSFFLHFSLHVAEIAGVVPSTVSRWMSGESAVPRLVLEKLRQVDAILNEK